MKQDKPIDTVNLEIKSTINPDTTSRHLNKYSNKNFFHQLTLGRFFDKISEEIVKLNPSNGFEFGCGEGLFLNQLSKRNIQFKDYVGIDLRDDALSYARTLHPDYEFLKIDLLSWINHSNKPFDLVIASQVLEHLDDPGKYVKKLVSLSCDSLLFTVPWEPWFRLMNFVRGRDFFRFGNHPEHINSWGFNQFKVFVSSFVNIETAYTVFPFIVVIGKK
jgi:hypothetical protein